MDSWESWLDTAGIADATHRRFYSQNLMAHNANVILLANADAYVYESFGITEPLHRELIRKSAIQACGGAGEMDASEGGLDDLAGLFGDQSEEVGGAFSRPSTINPEMLDSSFVSLQDAQMKRMSDHETSPSVAHGFGSSTALAQQQQQQQQRYAQPQYQQQSQNGLPPMYVHEQQQQQRQQQHVYQRQPQTASNTITSISSNKPSATLSIGNQRVALSAVPPYAVPPMPGYGSAPPAATFTTAAPEPVAKSRALKRKKADELGSYSVGGGGGGGDASGSAMPPGGVAPGVSMQLVEQPSENILSGRSGHLYTLQFSAAEIVEVSVSMEDEMGMRITDGGVVVDETNATDTGTGFTCVHMRMRMKPHRLKITSLLFEARLRDGATGEIRQLSARSRPFIVCSHITSQRPAAEAKIAEFLSYVSVRKMREDIEAEYAKSQFRRRLMPSELTFLLCTALKCTEAQLKEQQRVSSSNTRQFWKWFQGSVKPLKHLRPYWESGCIVGFMSKSDAERRIERHSNGCCIIRVSTSVPKSFAVTCKTIDGKISHKLIEKDGCKLWELFLTALQSFSGNLSKVIDVNDREIPFDEAFPPIEDEGVEAPHAGYDEHANVHEALRKERADAGMIVENSANSAMGVDVYVNEGSNNAPPLSLHHMNMNT